MIKIIKIEVSINALIPNSLLKSIVIFLKYRLGAKYGTQKNIFAL